MSDAQFDALVANNPDIVVVDDGDVDQVFEQRAADEPMVFNVVRIPDRTCYSTPRLIYTVQPPVNRAPLQRAITQIVDYVGPRGWLLLLAIGVILWQAPIFAFALWLMLLMSVPGLKGK